MRGSERQAAAAAAAKAASRGFAGECQTRSMLLLNSPKDAGASRHQQQCCSGSRQANTTAQRLLAGHCA